MPSQLSFTFLDAMPQVTAQEKPERAPNKKRTVSGTNLAFSFLDEIPVAGDAPTPQSADRAPSAPQGDNYTEIDVFHDLKRSRKGERAPAPAAINLDKPVHFYDIYTRGTFCGAETTNYASWFWCVTCKAPKDCPATFCPVCRAAFEKIWKEQKICDAVAPLVGDYDER